MIFLRNRRFALLWSSQLLSSIGDWLMVVAIPVYVFQLTHSVLNTGLATVAQIVPSVVVGPLAGVFVDRWPRRLTMVVSDLLRTGTVLAMLLVHRPGQVWIIFVAIFAENGIGQFFRPAHRALLPDLVGRGDDLATANAWYSVSNGIVRLLGGVARGTLYLVFSFAVLVVADSATFLISATLLTLLGRIRPALGPARPPSRRESTVDVADAGVLREFRAGLSYLVGHAMLRGLLVVSALFLLANSILSVLLVPYLVGSLGAGSEQVGLIMSALGVGYLVSAYVGKLASDRRRMPWAVVLCLLAIAGFFAGLFLWHSFVAALVFVGLVGVPGGALLLVVEVGLQRHTSDAMMGRVGAAFSTTQMLATLAGALAGGIIAGGAGIALAVTVSLSVLGVATLAAALLLPAAGARLKSDPPGKLPQSADPAAAPAH